MVPNTLSGIRVSRWSSQKACESARISEEVGCVDIQARQRHLLRNGKEPLGRAHEDSLTPEVESRRRHLLMTRMVMLGPTQLPSGRMIEFRAFVGVHSRDSCYGLLSRDITGEFIYR